MRLRLENLQKTYGGRVVLDIEHCEIAGGVITGIIGPNGAGKTTLTSIIAGLDSPDHGQVLYEVTAAKGGSSSKNSTTTSSNPDDSSPADFTADTPFQEVTMLFQSPYMLHTSVEKNIAYPLRLRGLNPEVRERRVQNLLQELDLTHLAKNKAWRLSGGETQKVALARAIALKPQVLLLDEPTSNIDNIHVAVIEKVLAKERDKNHTTMIFISHNLAQIKRLCDEVIFMEKGRVVEQGPTDKVLHSPQDPRTRAFVAGELLI